MKKCHSAVTGILNCMNIIVDEDRRTHLFARMDGKWS